MTVGGIDFATALMGLLTPRAPANDILNHLIKAKPEFYKFVDIDLSTARTDQVYDEPGTFIWVDNHFARGEVTLRLNELKFGKFDLRHQKYIQGPFFRFFITNGMGQGIIRLFISRGYQAASEPIEAINRAELAARLGSIVTFDRGGDILWIEDFESGIERSEISVSGTGASVTWSAEHALRGGFSCKLTAGSNASRYAQIKGYHSFPILSRLGQETAFTVDANMESTEAYLNIYTGSVLLQWGILFTAVTSTLSLLTTGGAWLPVIVGAVPYYTDYLFNLTKLIVDPSNTKYTKLIAGPVSADLSTLPCSITAPELTSAHLAMSYRIVGKAATNAVCYVDSMVLTQNEP